MAVIDHASDRYDAVSRVSILGKTAGIKAKGSQLGSAI